MVRNTEILTQSTEAVNLSLDTERGCPVTIWGWKGGGEPGVSRGTASVEDCVEGQTDKKSGDF
jgi:hypothetical protein